MWLVDFSKMKHMKRLTIIDFVEKYTHKFSELTFLREKVNGVWTEKTFRETREEAYRIGAGLYQLGLKKGDKMKKSYYLFLCLSGYPPLT